MLSAQACLRHVHGESKLSPSCIHINSQMFSDSPSPKEEPILLFIAAASSSVVQCRLLESYSIESVTLRIRTCSKGFVMNRQKDGDVLHLAIRAGDLQETNVKTYSGKEFTLSVDMFKKHVENKNGGDEDQEVLFDGLELADKQIIDGMCSHDSAVVHLVVRESTKVQTSKPVENILELSITGPNTKKRKRNDDIGDPKDCKEAEYNDRSPIEPVEPVKSDLVKLLEPLILNNLEVQLSEDLKDMISQTLEGLENGSSPVRTLEGTGGSYFMQDASGEKIVSVFKPADEEPNAVNNPHGLHASSTGEGLKKGTKVGEGALREVAAYVLDHPKDRSIGKEKEGFAGVPPTFMVKCFHSGFKHPEGCNAATPKFGSLQKFVKNSGSCEDTGPVAFPVSEVHKISVLDIRMANADRHAGNILISKDEEDGRTVLIPIDHGYCLPESFEDCTFEWLYWPQSRHSYSPETLEYIKTLDAEADISALKLYGWDLSEQCARTLRVSTMLLKKGAARGLTPYTIGSVMCRENLSTPSMLEEILREAEDSVPPDSIEAAFLDSVSQIMDHRLARVPE